MSVSYGQAKSFYRGLQHAESKSILGYLCSFMKFLPLFCLNLLLTKPPKFLCKTRQSDFSEYTSLCRHRSYNVQSLFVMMNNVLTMQQAQQFYFLFEILLREGQFPLQFHHHNFPSLVCCSKILDKVIFILFCAMYFRQI